MRNDQSVLDLKVTISEQPNGPAVSRQKLVYKGTTMQESNTVGEYNLLDGCKVHLILKKDDTSTQQTSNGPLPTAHANISANSTASKSESSSTPSSSCSITAATSISTRNNNSNYKVAQSDACASGSTLRSSTTPATAPITNDQGQNRNINQIPSRFEIILRERLAEHFETEAVEKIMANLQHEINADINSSSLDDLERLAKQKLNISNE